MAPEPTPPTPLRAVDDLLEFLRDDKIEQMADYLRSGGDANISLNSLKSRPINFARSAEMVDLLVGAGADLNVASELGTTAAHLMAQDDEVLPALQKLAKAGADLRPLDIYFDTPLDVAERENATACARWLKSIGAPRGPLSEYRRQHPLPKKSAASRPAGRAARMPSLVQPLRDRRALWQHLRELIQFWDPAVAWRTEPALSTADLNSLAGLELPAAFQEFYQSGIFDWLLWQTAKTGPYSLRCAWASADAIPRRRVHDFIPVMQHSNLGHYCIERDELGSADPVVRYADFRKLAGVHKCPPASLHTGCRLSEFVAIEVYGELVDVTPAQRYFDLDSSDHPQAVRLRQELTRCALPRLRSGLGNVDHRAIYEGPDMIYVEIESHFQQQNYYGILGGKSNKALQQMAVVDDEDVEAWEDDDAESDEN